jgi:uncharacterized protein
MQHNFVHWFELPATDLDRGQKFYEEVFSTTLTAQQNSGYDMRFFPMDMHSTGASGALVKGFGYKPSLEGPIIYFSTQDIDALIEKVRKAGGVIHVDKKDIGEYGWIAIFEDCEGNRIGLHMPRV